MLNRRMTLFLVVFACSLWFAYSADFSTGDNPGKIIIIRPSSNRLPFTFQILVNQEVLVYLDAGQYFEMTVDPGEYLLVSGITSNSILSSEVKPFLVKVESNKEVVFLMRSEIQILDSYSNFSGLKEITEYQNMRK